MLFTIKEQAGFVVGLNWLSGLKLLNVAVKLFVSYMCKNTTAILTFLHKEVRNQNYELIRQKSDF